MDRGFEDLTGKKFGYLKVLGIKQNGKIRRSWICKCDCGKVIVLGESRLLGTKTRRPDKSCGCMQLKQKGYSMSHPQLFGLWNGMIQRCYRKKNANYHKYGAKGIIVCDEWREEFEPFLKWSLNNGYEEGLTLDRIDNEKGYSPDNCRWVTHNMQQQNKGLRKGNTTGYKGVCPHSKGGYRAYISRNGVRKYLGVHKTIEQAAKARQYAEDYYNQHGKLPD